MRVSRYIFAFSAAMAVALAAPSTTAKEGHSFMTTGQRFQHYRHSEFRKRLDLRNRNDFELERSRSCRSLPLLHATPLPAPHPTLCSTATISTGTAPGDPTLPTTTPPEQLRIPLALLWFCRTTCSNWGPGGLSGGPEFTVLRWTAQRSGTYSVSGFMENLRDSTTAQYVYMTALKNIAKLTWAPPIFSRLPFPLAIWPSWLEDCGFHR